MIILPRRPSRRKTIATLPRRGFTIIELLVSLAVISVLVALLLPAVMRARGAARGMSCKNRLRQLSLAVLSHADLMGRFPAMGNFSATNADRYHSWVTSILPQIEQSPLSNRYDLSQTYDSQENLVVGDTHIETLVCPDDISIQPGTGNLSYVVNGGIGWTIPIDCPAVLRNAGGSGVLLPIDLNGDGVACGLSPDNDDADIMLALGMFFVENWPHSSGTVRHHKIADVIDGTSNTILMSENIRAGYVPMQNAGWSTPIPTHTAFFLSGTICESESCTAGSVGYERANDHSQLPSSQEAINSAITQPEGLAPWPSSLHLGKVNVAFADGHVSSLSELISGEVYAALISPKGARLSGPLQQQLVSGAEY